MLVQDYPVTLVCDILGMARSSYYYQAAEAPEEAKLTDEEYELWLEMAEATSANDDLMTKLIEAVPGDREPVEFGCDWSDVVAEVDASRRLERAELKWWRNRSRCSASPPRASG